MKKVLLALLVSALPICAVLADGDGVDVLPFSSVGDVVSGVVTAYPDGTASVSGQVMGVPFHTDGTLAKGPDGKWHFNPLFSIPELLIKRGSWIPISIDFWGTKDDASDGDETDDVVGEINVQSQSGMGKGAVRLTG